VSEILADFFVESCCFYFILAQSDWQKLAEFLQNFCRIL